TEHAPFPRPRPACHYTMLAALSKVNDPDSKANNTDIVHSKPKHAHTPSKDNIGSPCNHDWLLEKKKAKSAKTQKDRD
ncbi:MAG: hypothetical protein ACKPKO_30425, partial [Candidatus Fonsibacter sp.]